MSAGFPGSGGNNLAASISLGDTCTVMFWYRSTTTKAWTYSTVIDLLNLEYNTACLYDCENAGVGTVLSWYNGFAEATGSTLTTDQWYHIALVRNGSSVTIYLDGVADITGSDGGLGDFSIIRFGENTVWNEPNSGMDITAVKAWTAALSSTEIAAEIDNADATRTSDLVGQWWIKNGGSQTTDTSGASNDFTLTGSGITDEADPSTSLLNYGSGGSPEPTTPVIEAGDCTNSGNNTATTSWDVAYPAYSDGDLLLFHLVSDANVTHNWSATGPNGETVVDVVDSYGTSTNERVSFFYFVGSGSHAAGTFTVTPSASEQWTATVAKVPAGEFNASAPIDSYATGGSSDGANTSVPSPAWSATSGAGYGRIVVWLGVDADPITATPSGWTNVASVDRGAVSGTLSIRTAAATDGESIAAANWTIAGDSSSTVGYIINAPSDSTAITFTAHAATTSATNTPTLSVTRPLAANSGAASATGTAVLSVARAMSANSAAASATPDTVTLSNSAAFAANISAESTTPDTISAAVARFLVATVPGASNTPDALALAVARNLSAAPVVTSTTPDTVSLTTTRSLIANAAVASNTSSAALSVARGLSTGPASTSTTSDSVTLAVTAQISFVANAAVASNTGSLALAVARSLSAMVGSASSTPDTVVLPTTGQIAFTANAAAASATSTPGLTVARSLSATVGSASSTPDFVLAAIARPFDAVATASAITPDTVALANLVAIAAAPVAASATSMPEVAVTRPLVAGVPAVSATSTPVVNLLLLIVALANATSTTPDTVMLLPSPLQQLTVSGSVSGVLSTGVVSTAGTATGIVSTAGTATVTSP